MEPKCKVEEGKTERLGERTLWISLRLRTKHQKATFRYVYDNPGCVLHDIMEGTQISKASLLKVLSAMRDSEIILYEEEPGQHRRHYFVDYELVDEMLRLFRERVERYMALYEKSNDD